MNLPVSTKLKRKVAALAVLLSVAACANADDLLGYSSDAALYLVLTRQVSTSEDSRDSSLYALLVTTGSPVASEYRNAESFQLTRASDGAVYGWRAIGRSGTLRNVTGGVLLTEQANFELPWNSSSLGLGRVDLAEGASYELMIVSGDRTINGSTFLPETPNLELRREQAGTSVHWSRSTGAAAYFVIVDTDSPGAIVTLDTSYSLLFNRPEETRPAPAKIRIIAMDSNLYRYVTDTTITRAGLEGALGVFGGASSNEAILPEGPDASMAERDGAKARR